VSLSMRYLFAVAVIVALFEAVSAIWLDGPDAGSRVSAGAFAALMFLCAWAIWTRRSIVASSGIGLLLLVDAGATPFYDRTSWTDWAIQLGLCAVGLLGVIAWVAVLRSHRRGLATARA
jgi:hypothetical protein